MAALTAPVPNGMGPPNTTASGTAQAPSGRCPGTGLRRTPRSSAASAGKRPPAAPRGAGNRFPPSAASGDRGVGGLCCPRTAREGRGRLRGTGKQAEPPSPAAGAAPHSPSRPLSGRRCPPHSPQRPALPSPGPAQAAGAQPRLPPEPYRQGRPRAGRQPSHPAPPPPPARTGLLVLLVKLLNHVAASCSPPHRRPPPAGRSAPPPGLCLLIGQPRCQSVRQGAFRLPKPRPPPRRGRG